MKKKKMAKEEHLNDEVCIWHQIKKLVSLTHWLPLALTFYYTMLPLLLDANGIVVSSQW